jgi:hypothetical protein
MSYDRKNNGQHIEMPFELSDQLLFEKLFGSLSPENSTNPKAKNRQKFVSDMVLADLTRLTSSRLISKSDKHQLERYVQSLHDVEKSLQLDRSCKKSHFSWQYSSGADRLRAEQFSRERCLENYLNLVTLAFSCDLSRMLVLHTNWADFGSKSQMHHHIGEGDHQDPQNAHVAPQIWKYKLMLRLAAKLKEVREPHGEGSLMDNTLMIAMNEHGGRIEHSVRDVPTVTLGNLGGTLRSGYFIDCRAKCQRDVEILPCGHPSKRVLIAATSAMGVSESEYLSCGDGSGFGEFVVESEDYRREFFKSHNAPLDFFFKS